MEEEGHYTIKRVKRLPKKGNSNYLYVKKEKKINKFYRWLLDGSYEETEIGGEGFGEAGPQGEVGPIGPKGDKGDKGESENLGDYLNTTTQTTDDIPEGTINKFLLQAERDKLDNVEFDDLKSTQKIGVDAGLNNEGVRITATGDGSASGSSGNDITATGYNAARNANGNRITATGTSAASDSVGDEITATGTSAARGAIGNDITATGFNAAENANGDDITVVGANAGRFPDDNTLQTPNSTAFGANTIIDKANQIVIGDADVTEVKIGETLVIDKEQIVNADDGVLVTRLVNGKKVVEASETLFINSEFKGKNILWIGTSIPEGSTYPQTVCDTFGAVLNNKALGSSSVRIPDLSETPNWNVYTRALSHTLAEKENIISNWSTIRNSLSGTPPVTLTTDQEFGIRQASYENRLLPFLSNSDYIFFDHGFNDWNPSKRDDMYNYPSVRNDRSYFLGAINYLFDLIYESDFRKKIIFIGHYDNSLRTSVCTGQEAAAATWNIPIIKTWAMTGISGQIIGGNTILDNWIPDGIHPYTDTTGETEKLIADVLVKNLSAGVMPLSSTELINVTTATPAVNYLAKYVEGRKIRFSQFFDNGTNTGIGTANPQYKLDVFGDSRIIDGVTLGQFNQVDGSIIFQKNDSSSGVLSWDSNFLKWRLGGGGNVAGFRWQLFSTVLMQINTAGDLEVNGKIKTNGNEVLFTTGTPPTSPTDTGVKNQVEYDNDYVYHCTNANTWVRIAKDNNW